MTKRIASEEDLIRRYLAPLTKGYAGAFALRDDCAAFMPPPGEDLVLTMDAVAGGVHFFPDDAPGDIAWKALAVNVSDLAGKGARPVAYLMALSFPEAPTEAWVAAFSAGLERAQETFGLVLAGGDTDRRPGPLTVTITAIGRVPAGRMVQRTTAKAGDRIFVSGTLGDSALGLALRRRPELAGNWGLTAAEREHLLGRYLRPEPRLALREALQTCASAAMDVSDGLALDLSRMGSASRCGACVEAARLPLSPAARKIIIAEPERLQETVSGGDDFEILAAVPLLRAEAFRRQASSSGVAVTDIGGFEPAGGLEIAGLDGRPMSLSRTGWDHFGDN